MKVTARLFALYRETAGADSMEADVAAGTTVGQLWERMIDERPELAKARQMVRYTAYAVNGEWAAADQELLDGDEVAFLPPVSGGRDGAV